MKKTYIAPEVEIKRFNTEDIMNESAIIYDANASADTAADKATITYNELFNL